MKHINAKWLSIAVQAALIVAVIAGAMWVLVGERPGRTHAAGAEAGDWYTCGMHPWVVQRGPGKCPICHMELTPIDPDKFTGEIVIDPVTVQSIGVRVASVTEGPLTRTIRTIGTVVHDETTIRQINLRLAGWIETLYVDSTGAHVHQGDALFDIYSPELYSAQQELLIARRSDDLLAAARQRLENFGIDAEQIDELLRSGEASRTMAIRTPYTGHVIDKNASEGMRVEPGTMLYKIADHREVWVNVAVYESQLPLVSEGMPAAMTVPHLPGRVFEGEVVYIYPHLNPQTRQLTVRVAFRNPGLLLKPGMFADVSLMHADGAGLLVPREAIIDTGDRHVAFVSLGWGRFEPRDVTTGITTGDGRVQVTAGLSEGEQIVVSGQFLLDSESTTREALAKMIRGTPAVPPQVTGADADALRVPEPGETTAPYPLDVCLVTDLKIGSMGEPIVRVYKGQTITFCCPSCPPKFAADPKRYMDKLHELTLHNDHAESISP